MAIIFFNCSSKKEEFPIPNDPPIPPVITEPDTQCSDSYIFSRAPVDLSDITSMGVLGSLIPPGHTYPTPHLYMYVLPGNATSDNETQIYASSDMTLKTIVRKYYDQMGDLSDYTDYDLHFEVCDSLYMYFIHVRDVVHDDIIAAVEASSCPDLGSSRGYQECHINVDIPISLNEVIGTTGHYEARIYGLDVGIRDYRITDGRSAFVNPDRWCSATNPYINQRCFTACFFDYLEPVLASTYYPYFNNGRDVNAIQRSSEPICGTVYTDVANTLQGYWFNTLDEVMSENNGMYLGPNDYLGEKYSFSIGNAIPEVNAWVYSFTPENVGKYNRPFDQIDDQLIYAYRNIYNSLESLQNGDPPLENFNLLVQLSTDGNSLTIEKVSTLDTDPTHWSFGTNAVTFYR